MSTILGTYDAQMSDYSTDLDVLMQAHNSDPWTTQEDGIMEEDTFAMFSSKNTDNQNVPMQAAGGHLGFSTSTGPTDIEIEVEMQDYVEERDREYDMLDDHEPIVEDVTELQDIEVIDVQPSPDTSLTLAAPPSEPHGADGALSAALSIGSALSDLPSEHVHAIEKSESRASPEETPVTETTDAPASSALEAEVLLHQAGTVEGTTSVYGDTPDLDPTPSLNQGEPQTAEEPLEHHYVAEPPGTDEAPVTVSVVDSAREVPNLPDIEQTASSEGAATYLEATTEGQPEADSSATNPHEIADGVYIEPPPAVIIHMPFSEQSCVLFNLPSSSRSQSPSSSVDDVPPDTIVLLQDKPTLYYEPLSALFNALKEEDIFLKQPDLNHAELGFSIDNLHLSVFEDNVYAREISLHDLSILHDSFHTGLLRLQLLHHIPRFIVRYHELQDHLQRLEHDDTLSTMLYPSTSEMTVGQKDVVEDGANSHDDPSQSLSEDVQQEGAHQATTQEEADPPATTDNQVTEEATEHEIEEPDDTVSHENLEASEEGAHVSEEHVDATDSADIPDSVDNDDNTTDIADDGHHAVETNTVHVTPEENHNTVPPSDWAKDGDEGLVYVDPTDMNDDQDDSVEPVSVGDHQHYADEDESSEPSEYDPEQEDVDALHDDLEAGDQDSEQSGEGPFEDDNQVAGDDAAEDDDQEEVDERAPSPTAVEELPSIDTGLLVAAEDVGELGPSTSTPSEWLGEQFESTAEGSHESLHSVPAEEDAHSEDLDDNNTLAYPDAVEDEDQWDDDLDGEGEADPSWDGEQQDAVSNESSVTLGSVRSKRSFHDIDGDDDDEELGSQLTPSPDSKRSRLQ